MKKLLILAMLVCLGGTAQARPKGTVAIRDDNENIYVINENVAWTGYGIRVFCVNGYEYVGFSGSKGVSITNAFEYVDGVTRPKMCGGWE